MRHHTLRWICRRDLGLYHKRFGFRAAPHTGAGFKHGPNLDVDAAHVAIIFALGRVAALGLKLAQGLIITEAYYWDLNDRTRSRTFAASASSVTGIRGFVHRPATNARITRATTPPRATNR